MKRIFGLGLIVITPGLVNEVDLKVAITALMRHAGGDWGEVYCQGNDRGI